MLASYNPAIVARPRPSRRDRARLPGRPARAARPRDRSSRELVLKAGRPFGDIPEVEVPEWVRHTVRVAADLGRRLPHSVGRRARARDRPRPGPGRDGGADRGADGRRRRSAVADPGARPREDRRHRAPPRHRPHRARLRPRLRPPRRRARRRRSPTTRTTSSSSASTTTTWPAPCSASSSSAAASSSSSRSGVRAELPLPVAGPALGRAARRGRRAEPRLQRGRRALGCTVATPFLTLSFLALSVIPRLKITDRGLVDVDRFEIVPLAVE